MKRNSVETCIGLLAPCLLAVASVAAAQSMPSLRPGPTPVYIERFRGIPLGTSEDVAQFSQQFIRFELSKLPQLSPIAVTLAPACGSANAIQQKEPSRNPLTRFSIRGSVAAAADSSYELDVEVTRCTNSVSSLILHQSRLFRMRTANFELQSFAATISDAVRLGELPTVAVRVHFTAPVSPGAATAPLQYLRDRIISALLDVGVALAADSATANYAITVDPQGSTNEPTGLRVLFASAGRADTVGLPKGADTYDQLVNRVAALSARRLDALIHPADPKVGTTPAGSLLDTAVARARAALCLGTPPDCRAAPEAAAAALDALPSGAANIDVLTLRGLSDLAQGKLGPALGELRGADSLRALSPSTRHIPEASERDLRMAIGDVYRAAGNHSRAALEYQQLASKWPGDSTIRLLLSQSLRLAGRRVDALDSGTAALARFPGYGALRSEVIGNVQDVSFGLAADSLPRLVLICRRDPQVQRACVSSMAAHAESGTLDGAPQMRVRSVLAAASRLAGGDTAGVTRVAVAQALAFIGQPVTLEENGGLVLRSSSFQRDSVDRYLGLAGSLGPGTSDSTRERLYRVRAYRAALVGNYSQAFGEASRAYRARPNRDDALLSTLVATILVSRGRVQPHDTSVARYAREWTPELQRASRALIDTAVMRFPDDESLLTAKAHFCSDYAFDPRCSFNTDSLRFAKGMLRSNADILDAVEAAVVVDKHSLALTWLKTIPSAQLGACEQTVAGLYEFWASAAAAREGMADAFAKWRKGIGQYRETHDWNCWVFEGAKTRLAKAPVVAEAATLLAMIRAYENASAPIPGWR